MSRFSRNLMIAVNALFVLALLLASAWPEHKSQLASDSSRQGPSQVPTHEIDSILLPTDDGDDAALDSSTVNLLLLRGNPTTQPVWTCPASNADKWDFGGGVNTAVNWNNWRGEGGSTHSHDAAHRLPTTSGK